MSCRTISRRRLMQSAAAGAALGVLRGNPFARAAESASTVKILEPIHGAVLNHRHGRQTAEGLTIRVSGTTRPDRQVTLNGKPCRVEGGRFFGEATLREHETDLVAAADGPGGRDEDHARVVWDRHSQPRYRFSIDDSSFFLRDIAQKQYRSLFECPFLKILHDLNKNYGAKFSVNIYYAVADNADFPTDASFRISQFPDRYKGQWRANSDWLKLAFHAYANMPSYPYSDAPPEKLIADLDLVAGEILRFAGEEAYAPPTVIHWGMTRPSAFKPLFDRGVRALSGFFIQNGGRWNVNYHWDDFHSEYLSRHDAWKDFDSGIVFSKVDLVCNNVPLDRTVATLEPLTKNPDTAEIMDLFTHEQYFWPFYHRYLPDHAQRLDAAIRWCTEQGYKPVFYHEGFLGGRAQHQAPSPRPTLRVGARRGETRAS